MAALGGRSAQRGRVPAGAWEARARVALAHAAGGGTGHDLALTVNSGVLEKCRVRAKGRDADR